MYIFALFENKPVSRAVSVCSVANQHSGKKKTVRFARFHLITRSGTFPDAHLFPKIPGVHTHSYSHIHAHTHKYTLHPLGRTKQEFCLFQCHSDPPAVPSGDHTHRGQD